jgi:SAM-dependent methyltransferase
MKHLNLINQVESQFPFENYMSRRPEAYHDILSHVENLLDKGARILDFGAGPCDKTAVVQQYGYNCVAYDDLGDPWHKRNNNQEKIKEFAKKVGVDFIQATSHDSIPFSKNTFDMIMLHGVIEHFHSSPRILLNQLISFLKTGGYLYITVPNAVNIRKRLDVLRGRTNLPPYDEFYWCPNEWRGHIREYTKGDLQQLGQFLKLKNIQLHGCHHMLERFGKHQVIKYIYKTCMIFFPNMRDVWTFIGQKPQDWQPQTEISLEVLK